MENQIWRQLLADKFYMWGLVVSYGLQGKTINPHMSLFLPEETTIVSTNCIENLVNTYKDCEIDH